MNEVKNHWKKWLYWFLLGVAIIIVYKAFDNFGSILEALGKFFSILSPFFVGIFIAYLFYMPCKNIEKVYHKSKNSTKLLFLKLQTCYLQIAIYKLK